jgi:hypothetical protein
MAGKSDDLQAQVDAATREYEVSRDRYIQTIKTDAAERVLKPVAKRREKLVEEIENLRLLGMSRSEARSEAVKAYSQRAPGKVTATSLVPPSAADRLSSPGIDRVFKTAVKAAEEFKEVNDILKKRRDALEAIDQEIRTVVAKHNEDLIRLLETPDGLTNAFKRDPLLGQAHARMKAAIARRDAARAGAPESAAS